MINYEGSEGLNNIYGSVYEVINKEDYRNYRIGDLGVTRVGLAAVGGSPALYIKGVKL